MIRIDNDRRERLKRELRGLFREKFDEDMSEFRADEMIDFFLGALGPQVYNQAVQDARTFVLEKLEDLDGEVHVPDIL